MENINTQTNTGGTLSIRPTFYLYTSADNWETPTIKQTDFQLVNILPSNLEKISELGSRIAQTYDTISNLKQELKNTYNITLSVLSYGPTLQETVQRTKETVKNWEAQMKSIDDGIYRKHVDEHGTEYYYEKCPGDADFDFPEIQDEFDEIEDKLKALPEIQVEVVSSKKTDQ